MLVEDALTVCAARVFMFSDDQMQQQSYLLLGKCKTTTATLLTEKNPNPYLSVGCPYVYSSIINHRYVALLHNMSDLNDACLLCPTEKTWTAVPGL